MQTMDDKKQLVRAFDNCLANFSTGRGTRNSILLPRAACLAVKLGMDENSFAETMHAVAADMRADEFRRAFRSGGRKVEAGAGNSFQMRRKSMAATVRTYPQHVRNMIAAGGDVLTFEGLKALSPAEVKNLTPEEQARHQLRRLFSGGDDYVYIYRSDKPTRGILGRSLRRVGDWLGMDAAELLKAGEVVVPNAFTGGEFETVDGKPSYIAQACLATFSHAVLEFDELPMAEQCAFWAGYIRTCKIPLVCLTYSGGKSIHGCIYVGAADLAEWNERRARLVALFAADKDAAYRVDIQELRPRQGMRLAGVCRESTGKRQELLWMKAEGGAQ